MSLSLRGRPVSCVLLDISGVLYNSGEGDGVAIPGSVDAVNRLYASGVKLRFCSNESQNPRSKLVAKLNRLGFSSIRVEHVFTPAPVTALKVKKLNLNPFLLTYPDVKSEFPLPPNENYDSVVVGDAAEFFTYDNVNKAFNVLLNSEKQILFTMGMGKYYMETDGVKIDLGAYARALEYACDCTAVVIGKPSKEYFEVVLEDAGVDADHTVMVGDDIAGDIEGAQKSGMRAIQVRTGKFRKEWENHPSIRPDEIADDLAAAVNLLIS